MTRKDGYSHDDHTDSGAGSNEHGNNNKNNIDNYSKNSIDDDELEEGYDLTLNECGCCLGITKVTPVHIRNPPGLSAIQYRVGTHSQFKSSMLANLHRISNSKENALGHLTTRSDNDLTIALLDSWAVVADVLSFYQERIANEGFLRTANDHKSIVELAHSIGYELRPGVAAGTYLAFTIDPSTTTNEKTTIPVGTKVQSIPTNGGRMPQMFETIEEIPAHAEWNELRPRLYEPQSITPDTTSFYFQGTNTSLKKGDPILIVKGRGKDNAEAEFAAIVYSVEEEHKLNITIVEAFSTEGKNKPITRFNEFGDYTSYPITSRKEKEKGKRGLIPKIDLDKITLEELHSLTSYKWSLADLNAFASKNNFELKEFFHIINELASNLVSFGREETRIFAFRIKGGIFGNNAPRYDSMPAFNRRPGGEPTLSYRRDRADDEGLGNPRRHEEDVSYAPIMGKYSSLDGWIFLDNVYQDILPSSTEEDRWILLKGPLNYRDWNNNQDEFFFDQISEVRHETRSRYLITSKSTGIAMSILRYSPPFSNKFTVRTTTFFAKCEPLLLADKPIDRPIGKEKSITLDHAVENSLRIGQRISITGEIIESQDQAKNIYGSEIATIADIELDGIYTKIILCDKISNLYRRSTVTINANIAEATHGETKEETLGGGDPLQKQQQFFLREKPLTYVSAPTPRGTKSTLKIRIDGILWREVPYLYGHSADDKIYTLRASDSGNSKIVFGDGTYGARPPSGKENITAKYRAGIGLDGLVGPEKINLLAARPLGVKSVKNPIESSGANDPETMSDARKNATLNVLTLDRIVSVSDVENFASAFGGIGKAQAVPSFHGSKRIVRLTIASVRGDIIDEETKLHENLSRAIENYSDPSLSVVIESFDKLLFDISAKIAISDEYLKEIILSKITETLLVKFSFQTRQFRQPVTLSEVIATIQNVKGVIAVAVEKLYVHGSEQKSNDLIPEISDINNVKTRATVGSSLGGGEDPESNWLLVINPGGIILEEMNL